MRTRTLAIITAVLAWAGLSGAASAQDWSLVLNGKSIHVNSSKDWNERNWGLGIEREFDGGSRWVKVALINGFRDSANEMSYMAGGGMKRRFRLRRLSDDLFVDLGVIAFLMTREDVNDNEPFPGLLPALTVGTPRIALNMTYLSEQMMDSATNVSRVDPTVSGLIFLQLKIHPSMLGFGQRGRLR